MFPFCFFFSEYFKRAQCPSSRNKAQRQSHIAHKRPTDGLYNSGSCS